MKIAVIVNPRAGRGLGAEVVKEIRTVYTSPEHQLDVEETTGPGDEVRLGRQAANNGTDLLLAVGGDGTLNGAVNGLLSTGRSAEELPLLASVPAGTGGDFARGLGYPSDPSEVVRRLPEFVSSPIDAGRLTFGDAKEAKVRYWINQSYIGLGARVVERVNRSGRISGARAYTMASLAEAMHPRCPEYRLSTPERGEERFEALNILVANGTHSGGGMQTAPLADLSDGRWELILVTREAIAGATPRLKVLKNLSKFKDGSYLRLPGVRSFQVSALGVQGGDGELVEADGEIVGHLPANYALLPRALRVLHPAQHRKR